MSTVVGGGSDLIDPRQRWRPQWSEVTATLIEPRQRWRWRPRWSEAAATRSNDGCDGAHSGRDVTEVGFFWSEPWMSRAYDPCTDRYAKVYYNRPEVQIALHANVPGIKYPWDTCSDTVGNYWADSPKSMLPIYKELIAGGIRIWVYSGDTDSVVPVTATRYSIDALNLTTVTNWYPWYDNGQVGGWSQVYKGLTFVTITGAGHEVPLHRPRQALILFRHFLKNSPMPK